MKMNGIIKTTPTKTMSLMDTLPEPPTASVRPYPQHCHDLALQKYLLLQEQHESLRQHLDELRPSRQSSLCTPVSPSPAASPTRVSHQHPLLLGATSLPAAAAVRKRSYPGAMASGPGAGGGGGALAEVALEEAKLCDVNEGIKRALTELLNCETVRGDSAFRTWVQCRLMDTERELRSGRRRRSAPGP